MVQEMWEGRGEYPTVVEFVLNLLERLHNAKELVEDSMKSAQA